MGLDVVLRVVATVLWTPVDLFESAQQAAVEDLAFQDLPARARESTCSSLDAYSEGQLASDRFKCHLAEAEDGTGWPPMSGDER